MCGIFGIMNFTSKNAVGENRIRRAIGMMEHRGPDDDGVLADRYAAIGMKRLKIIDLAGGHQPMSNETGEISIVFNGEIYNYIELREVLLGRGHRFKTKSDTEVILHLFEEYGPACLEKLNGMFSFAIWNSKKEEMFVARDRLGVKPLFYSLAGGNFIFSSELRPILADEGFDRAVDKNALIDYFSFYYISSPKTLYKNIRRLQPGHCITVANGRAEIKRYWDYSFRNSRGTEKDFIREIDETLLASVKRHLRSDVPLGVFLSSGLDSASIVAMMSRLNYKARTYTIGYENGESYNELAEARLVAKKYGTEHSDCMLKPSQLVEFIPQIIEHLAEPNGDWTQAALYYLSRQSRKDVTVVLSGAGGDELFGGYPTLTAAKIAKYYKLMPRFVRNLVKASVRKLPSSYGRMSFDFKAKSFVAGADMPYENAHMRYKEIFSDEERRKLLYNTAGGDPFEVYAQYLGAGADKEMLNRLLYLDLNVFLPDCVLQVTDMATMMNSQECRVPFLDTEMIELSQRIPADMKLRGFTTKYILRKALKKYLPEEILKMPKKGLAMPTAFWLGRELKDFITGIISDAEKGNDGSVNFDYVKNIYREHAEGRKDNTRKITCLVSYFLWQKKYG